MEEESKVFRGKEFDQFATIRNTISGSGFELQLNPHPGYDMLPFLGYSDSSYCEENFNTVN